MLNSHVTIDYVRFDGGFAGDGGILRVANGYLLLRDLVILGGFGVDGGAVALESSALVVERALVTGCSASSRGGAVFASNSTVRMSASTLLQNTAMYGGGVAAVDSVSLTGIGADVTGNSATFGGNLAANGTVVVNNLLMSLGSATYGGSVFVLAGSVFLNGVVARDSWSEQGGIAYIGGNASCSLDNTTFQNGTAVTSGNGGRGGGMLITDNAAVVGQSGSVVRACSAQRGGCVEVSGSGTLESVLLDGCTATLGGGCFAQDTTVYAAALSIVNCRASVGGGSAFIGSNVVLASVRIANNSAAVFGGAAYLANTTLVGSSTDDVVLVDNVALQGGGVGTDGTCRISTISIARNRGTDDSDAGGGMRIRGAAVLANTILSENTGSNGGGISVHNESALSLISCTLIGNRAALFGGAVLASGSSTVVADVATEIVSGYAMYGGAVACIDCAHLSGLRIRNSGALAGGAIHLSGKDSNDITHWAVLSNISIFSATATTAGGGVWASSARVLMLAVNVSQCAASDGGGVFIENVVIQDGSAGIMLWNNSASVSGGNVYSEGACNMTGMTVTGGVARNGGGWFISGGPVVISYSAGAENIAHGDGAGAYASGSALRLLNVSLDANQALNGRGGGLCLQDSICTGENVVIAWNQASNGGGIGAWSSGSATSQLNGIGTLVRNNAATSAGGAAYFGQGHGFLSNVVILDNSASTGGGVAADVLATVSLSYLVVGSNSAVNGGGLSAAATSAVSGRKLTFSGNTATASGGALDASGSVALSRCTLFNNSAVYGGSAAIDGVVSAYTLKHSVVHLNYAHLNGGAASCTNGALCNFDFDVFSSNAAGSRGGSLYMLAAEVLVNGSSITGSGNLFTRGVYSGPANPHGTIIDAASGAGLYALSCTSVIIENCTFDLLVATTGAAVYAESTAIVVMGAAVTACYGGGIAFSGVAADITALTLRNSGALFDGGGLWISQSVVTMRFSEIGLNRAQVRLCAVCRNLRTSVECRCIVFE
jgi:fibronectin-binding autotransporter adhesin